MRSIRLHRTALAALAAACLWPLTAHPASAQHIDEEAAVTWGVNPSSQDGPDGRAAFDYQLDPGDTLIDFVSVSNFSAEPITVTLYASDAYTTETGAFDLLPSDAESIDVGTWIGFNEQQLTIEPETRLDVPFALTVPTNATPGDHVGGIVAAIAENATDEGGNEFIVERRVGARIHLRVSGDLEPTLTPEIDDETYHYEWNPLKPGDTGFDYTVENTGNVRLAGTLVARISGPWDLLAREVEVAELPQILPGDSFAGSAEVDEIWPLALLNVELIVRPEPVDEADTDVHMIPRSTEESLWAPPWTQGAVLAALILTLWITVKVRRRRRRRAVQSTPEPAESADETDTAANADEANADKANEGKEPADT